MRYSLHVCLREARTICFPSDTPIYSISRDGSKILTYALVRTWSLVSSRWEHVTRKMHPWIWPDHNFKYSPYLSPMDSWKGKNIRHFITNWTSSARTNTFEQRFHFALPTVIPSERLFRYADNPQCKMLNCADEKSIRIKSIIFGLWWIWLCGLWTASSS